MLERIKKSPKLKWLLRILLAIFGIFILFYFSIYFGLFGKIPSAQDLSSLQQSEATQVLSSDGKLIGKYYIFDRQPIEFKQLPPHLIHALIATEDARFYEHNGIDTKSLFRVIFKTLLLQDKSSGGGSTITLQLAKNLYGRKDYGSLGIVINKIQESIIARRLERVYSKNQILTLYFNTVPFSDNTFGIESAAMKFFNKHTSELSLSESATLIGTLKASHSYNPRIFPERSRLRRDVVLSQMQKYNYISTQKMEEAQNDEIGLDYQYYSHNEGIAPYFREQLRKDLVKMLDTLKNSEGEKFNLYRDGLLVHTTLNYTMQRYAEAAVSEQMAALQEQHEKSYGKSAPWLKDKRLLLDVAKKTDEYKKLKKQGLSDSQILQALDKGKREMEFFNYNKNELVKASTLDSIKHYLKFLNAGFMAVEPTNGAVKAWVGGVDFEHFKYDHVSQSQRQVGSTFKPIVYTAALEKGMDPCSYFSANAVTYENGWTPTNAGKIGDDPYMNYNLKTALSHSVNTIAVKVLMETGIDKVIAQARSMGIESPIPKVPSIALGTAELKLEELAKAYTSFVNHGKPTTPYYITSIEDAKGNLLAKFEPEIQQEAAFSETNREIMIQFMKATVEEGTATRLRTKYGLTNDIAGKTGTTQSNKDGWFVGITPKLIAVTWVGSDDQRIGFRNTAIGQGANSALPIFALFLKKLNADRDFAKITSAHFQRPSNKVEELLDCDATKRDGFFKRLLTNPDKKNKDKKEKKGFFQKLFGKKKKDKKN